MPRNASFGCRARHRSPQSVTGIFLRDINQREGIFVGVLNETEGSGREGDRETKRPVDADRTCRFRGGRGRRLGRTELNCGSVAIDASPAALPHMRRCALKFDGWQRLDWINFSKSTERDTRSWLSEAPKRN